MKKRGIALLITLMFVIVITALMNYGLKLLNDSMQKVEEEKFIYQNVAIANDVISILKTSPYVKSLKETNSSDEFFNFLQNTKFIPLNSSDIQIKISLHSARGKFNPNIIAVNKSARDYLREYLNNNFMVGYDYVDVLLDNMTLYKKKDEKNNFYSDIFEKRPELFRDYIASEKHLKQINEFYEDEENTNGEKFDKIPFNNLFYYSKDTNVSIDLNYATPEVWQLLLGVNKARAESLYKNEGTYHSLKELKLTDEEQERLSKFNTSFYEPCILVDIFTQKENLSAHISFEYDIKQEKVSKFVFEI